MKGLTQFIVDIRNSQDQHEERKRINLEINNIQSKFNSGLNHYQRKKYICKLIYIYLLGYDKLIDFGTPECLNLITSSKIPEKQLGYLYMSVMMQNKGDGEQYLNEIFGLISGQLINDLKIDNEDINVLALQFIANNFNVKFKIDDDYPNAINWVELIDNIYSIIISPVNSVLLKKKSILAFKTMITLYPDIIMKNTNWIPRLLNLIDTNQDISIIFNSIKLIEILINLKPNYISSIIPSVTTNLFDIIINNKCPENYYYFKIPSPWLIVKLLQLLQSCFLINPDLKIDEKNLNNLKIVISKSIQNASRPIQGLTNRNSQSSILFEAVSLAIFLQASDDAINGAIKALIDLLTNSETNTRYLSLDVLIKLIGRSINNKLIINYQNLMINNNNFKIFLYLLNDKDISVRRKTLDLLYIITNDDNYQDIINKLIDYYPGCDIQLKLELSIKIAVLCEKFAKQSDWYVNIMIKLISIPTTNEILNNEIWERICQILINNQSLHKSTTKLIIMKLSNLLSKGGPISDNLIKLSSFIIGEFGPLVVNDYSPSFQFKILYDVYLKVNVIARCIILSSFMKMLKNFPNEDFVANIVDLLEIETNSLDLEIQTRAHEYLRTFTSGNLHLIKNLPPFETKHNHLLARIGNVDKIVGGVVNVKNIQKPVEKTDNPFGEEATINGNNKDNATDHNNGSNRTETSNTTVLSPNWYNGYIRMFHFDAGIFFENQLIKLTYRIIKDNFNLVYKFTIINNAYKTTKNNLTNFKILDIKKLTNSVNPNYLIDISSLPDQLITDKSTLELLVKIRNIVEMEESPIISITFNVGGSFNQLNLKVPINLLKTITPTALSIEEFKNRWIQINQLLPNNQGEFQANTITNIHYNSSNIVRLLQRLNLSIIHENLNTEGILILAAGILHTQSGKYGGLISIKSVGDVGKEFEIIVKCTGGGVSEIIGSSLIEIFQAGF